MSDPLANYGSPGCGQLMSGRDVIANDVCRRLQTMLARGFRAKITINIDKDELRPDDISVEVRSPQRSKV